MPHFSTELILILLGGIVVVSYLFSIISNYFKVPSVLLLLVAGIVVRAIADAQGWTLPIPSEAL
jgi:Kef-type K+ transport system membrane component KefB